MDISPFQYPECWQNWSSLLPSRKSFPLQSPVKKFLSFLVGVEMNPRKPYAGCLQVYIRNTSACGWCHPPSLPISIIIIYVRLENAVERGLILDFRLGRSYLVTAVSKEYKARLLFLCFCALGGPSWEMMQYLERKLGTKSKNHVLTELIFPDRSYWPAKQQIWDTWLGLTNVTMSGCSQPSKPHPLKTAEKYIKLLTDSC